MINILKRTSSRKTVIEQTFLNTIKKEENTKGAIKNQSKEVNTNLITKTYISTCYVLKYMWRLFEFPWINWLFFYPSYTSAYFNM